MVPSISNPFRQFFLEENVEEIATLHNEKTVISDIFSYIANNKLATIALAGGGYCIYRLVKLYKSDSKSNYFATHQEKFKDSITFELDETLLNFSNPDDSICTPTRSIDGSWGGRWRLRIHPSYNAFKQLYLAVKLETILQPANVKFTADLMFPKAKDLPSPVGSKQSMLVSHESIQKFNAIQNGKLVFRVDVTFTFTTKIAVASPSLPMPPERMILYDLTDNPGTSDAVLIVEGKRIEVHRGFLKMISPVFHAMFTHNTKEAKSGNVYIKDFKSSTVQTAINYIYGRGSKRLSMDEVVDIYVFADKYCMKSVSDNMVAWILQNLDITNFYIVVKNTWNIAKPEIKTACGELYYRSLQHITLKEEFLKLPTDVIIEIMHIASKF